MSIKSITCDTSQVVTIKGTDLSNPQAMHTRKQGLFRDLVLALVAMNYLTLGLHYEQ